MRRVGQMDRVVTIQRVTATTIDDFGAAGRKPGLTL